MAAALKLNDAGTWRTPTIIKVNDAGTWRTIKTIKMNDAGIWRTVYNGFLYNGTIAQAQWVSTFTFNGFSTNGSHGSTSPTTLTDGMTLYEAYDINSGNSFLSVTGFSSDPGASYFTSCSVNGGAAITTASRSNYSYNSGTGTATWTWGSQVFGFTGSGSATFTMTK